MSTHAPLCKSTAHDHDETSRPQAVFPILKLCGPCGKSYKHQKKLEQQRIRRAKAKAAKKAAAEAEAKEQEAKEQEESAQPRPQTAPHRQEAVSLQQHARVMRETTAQVAHQIRSVATTVSADVTLERKTVHLPDGTSTIVEVR